MKALLLVVVALVAASCTYTKEPETFASIDVPETVEVPETTPSTSVVETTPAEYEAKAPIVPGPLASIAIDTVELDGQELLVAIADTPDLRRQGLMNVPDLLDLDGMLFIFGDDSSGGFWMKDTLIPLDIAFFDASGAFVDGFAMEPCTTDDCPTYRPGGPYRYALEMAAGDMPADPRELGVQGTG
jgi:uncharacterized membrane protein (UPF0127 family)